MNDLERTARTDDKAAVLCRIDIESFGAPPRNGRVEAHAQPEGFSVWLWDDDRCPGGMEIGRSLDAYDARVLARIILDFGVSPYLLNGFPLHKVSDDVWSAARVSGETGLKAFLLRLCVTTGERDSGSFMGWQALFVETEAIVANFSSSEWDHLFRTLVDACVECHYGPVYVLNLLKIRRYPVTADGLRKLTADLASEANRLRRERIESRQAAVHPFLSEIEAIAARYSDVKIRGDGGDRPSPRELIRAELRYYVSRYKCLPRYTINLDGTLDFEARFKKLARLVPFLDEIEFILSKFCSLPMFRAGGTGWIPRLLTEWRLGKFVMLYGRMPAYKEIRSRSFDFEDAFDAINFSFGKSFVED
jgi:hypothetical protein